MVILTVLSAYLYFVLKWGPSYMKNRKPFELRTVMLIYNAIQVIYNIILASMVCGLCSYCLHFQYLNIARPIAVHVRELERRPGTEQLAVRAR